MTEEQKSNKSIILSGIFISLISIIMLGVTIKKQFG